MDQTEHRWFAAFASPYPRRCTKWNGRNQHFSSYGASASLKFLLDRDLRATLAALLGAQSALRVVMPFRSLAPHSPAFLLPVRPDSSAWDNREAMPEIVPANSTRNLLSPGAKIAAIASMVVALAILVWMTPPHFVVMHNILHHLNILPLMLAGMLFGWRGAVKTLLFSTVLVSPSIYRHWHTIPLDAKDQIVELTTFGIAGIIAGVVADRERLQRLRVESTKLELERVYIELSANVQQMKKTERLTAAGQLAASLAHEIRNPLASISGAAGILARGQAPIDSQKECLDILMKESVRLNKLLTNFLDFARPRLPRFQWTEPILIIRSVIILTQHLASRQDITLDAQVPQMLPEIECDAEQIKQVLLNLVLNAVQASAEGKRVTVTCSTTSDRLRIEVTDEGIGIPLANLDHIFDPFFTTKESGTGLGLSVAANIITQHGGTLTCRVNDGGRPGMSFRVEVPLVRLPTVVSHSVYEKVATL